MNYELLGIGGTSLVSAASDGKTALKGYEVWIGDTCCAKKGDSDGCEESLAREAAVYEHLGEHSHILKCYGLIEVHPGIHSLQLELAPCGNIRQFIRDHKDKPPSEQQRLKMALGVSSGLAYAHAKNVVHCDISCRNLFLFPNWYAKVGDFGSALLDGTPPTHDIVEEIRYELPLRGRLFAERPYLKRELFALGSAIYEIMAWKEPYEGLEDEVVEKKYAAEEFPDPTYLLAGNIIQDCWNEKFDMVKEVEDALTANLTNQAIEARVRAEDLIVLVP